MLISPWSNPSAYRKIWQFVFADRNCPHSRYISKGVTFCNVLLLYADKSNKRGWIFIGPHLGSGPKQTAWDLLISPLSIPYWEKITFKKASRERNGLLLRSEDNWTASAILAFSINTHTYAYNTRIRYITECSPVPFLQLICLFLQVILDKVICEWFMVEEWKEMETA